MRALYLPSLPKVEGELIYNGEKLHHLLNVIRLKQGDELLLLDGKGFSALACAEKISKRELLLQHQKANFHAPPHHINLAMAMIKREALEKSLKAAVEQGIKKIFLIETDFSNAQPIKEDRIEKLLISALEQSNSLYLPEIQVFKNLEEYLSSEKLPIVYFDSQTDQEEPHLGEAHHLTYLIGPEGGFSEREIEQLNSSQAVGVHLFTPILRAETAVSVAFGWLLGALKY